jgi:drug/metabolite transporter (DMT)-like permease
LGHSKDTAKISPSLAYLMATGTVLGWATGIVIGRGIHEVTPPIGLSFWRWFVPAICLFPWVIPKLKNKEGSYLQLGNLLVPWVFLWLDPALFHYFLSILQQLRTPRLLMQDSL